jgi:proteic killer suppression protein
MDLPGFGLHPLKGNLKDFWSVTVRANWRIIFRFEDGEAGGTDGVKSLLLTFESNADNVGE